MSGASRPMLPPGWIWRGPGYAALDHGKSDRRIAYLAWFRVVEQLVASDDPPPGPEFARESIAVVRLVRMRGDVPVEVAAACIEDVS
jgi:hypothetical protein